jgi:hypothetical protein
MLARVHDDARTAVLLDGEGIIWGAGRRSEMTLITGYRKSGLAPAAS